MSFCTIQIQTKHLVSCTCYPSRPAGVFRWEGVWQCAPGHTRWCHGHQHTVGAWGKVHRPLHPEPIRAGGRDAVTQQHQHCTGQRNTGVLGQRGAERAILGPTYGGGGGGLQAPADETWLQNTLSRQEHQQHDGQSPAGIGAGAGLGGCMRTQTVPGVHCKGCQR
jgi:hypothetical protein